jgi:hypothetical protein
MLSSSDKTEPYASLFKKSQQEFEKVFPNLSDNAVEHEDEFKESRMGSTSLFLFHRLDAELDFWNYFDRVLPGSSVHDFFVFTHPYQNENSRLNWQRIVNHKDFHVTIDCFHLGIAIKRTQQVKEHFQLRY